MVTGIGFDERTGRATGVHYIRGGVPRFQRAAAVAVAGYSIETPRLLLNSASRRFPDGLCNDFDQVGRYLMVQGAPQTAGRFDAEVRMYKSPPPEVSSEQFYETDPAKPYKRGFSIQTVSPLPITWAEHVAAQGHWGARLRQYMSDYVHWSCLGALCEFLAQPGQPGHPGRREGPLRPARRRTSPTPSATTTTSSCGPRRTSWSRSCTLPEPTRSSPSTVTPTWSAAPGWPPTSGTAWWTATAARFAVPNLYITDGSVLPTQGSANPALTIMAVAARAAAHLAAGAADATPEGNTHG